MRSNVKSPPRGGSEHMRALRRIFRMVVLAAVAVAAGKSYGKDPVSTPDWLDTTAPKIRIEPVRTLHRALFHVSIVSNEPAQLWFSRNSPGKMQRYRQPITVARDGTYRFYFYGEDDFGNRSLPDSIEYVFDSRPPELAFDPLPGILRRNSRITLRSNEPCRFYFVAGKADSLRNPLESTFLPAGRMEGYFAAVDSAGNRTFSDKVVYQIDTSRLTISISPGGGIYRVAQMVTLTAPQGAEAWYSFDPLAPPEWFVKYTEPVRLPHGLTIFRYFARSPSGLTSEIGKTSFVLDTIAPRLHCEVGKGNANDTVRLSSKEPSVIRFTADGSIPGETSAEYTRPLLIAHAGISRIRAKAWDRAGNMSEILQWEYKYDHLPPVVTPIPAGGIFRQSVIVMLSANEPAKILYTINGTPVNESALLFTPGGILISRQGLTEVRFRGIDAADNSSGERVERYMLDSRPPEIKVRIQGDFAAGKFTVYLLSDEPATIYYTVNGHPPTTASSVYRDPLDLKSHDILQYFGTDSVGNAGTVIVLDELNKPLVEAQPNGGTYNRRIRIGFDRIGEGAVWWRLLPDTLFRAFTDTILLDREGTHTLEYYLQSSTGLCSAVRRNDYFLDWTAPGVGVRIQRGAGDSAVLFFDADENASIYFTTDGSNPMYSANTRSAGNKFQRASDRVTLRRDPNSRLAWYAEDAAGNQGALSILDVFNPRVIPSIPSGSGRLYDRVLSLSLQSQEGTVIHYERHGGRPSLQSPIFSVPLTISSSDTVVAFVIDGSGYRGEPENFIYLIDHPPSPQFVASTDSIYAGMQIVFDAAGTFDNESPPERLKYRWDFNDDGRFDTDSGYFPKVTHSFAAPGMVTVVLQVIDERGRKSDYRKEIGVRSRCPADMVPTFDGTGRALCIDRYEWPNRKNAEPSVNVSWVEAKMACIDAGKRLCSRDEWVTACNNNASSMYPYGDHYDPQHCATEEAGVIRSGTMQACVSNGIADMVGNAWEWVEDKQGDYVSALGGSYRYGKDANCRLQFDGTVAIRSNETGFRCCK